MFIRDFFRTQKRLNAINDQLLAWESGALDVTFADSSEWLNFVLYAKQFDKGPLWKSKNIILEKHNRYKSYHFDYAPNIRPFYQPLHGTLIQFDLSIKLPNVLICRPNYRRRLIYKNRRRVSQFMIPDHFPKDLSLYAENELVQDFQTFVTSHHYFSSLFKIRNLVSLFIHDNFVALFHLEVEESAGGLTNKDLFSLDEKIANVILGRALTGNDPADQIRLLKDEEANSE